MRIFIYLLIFSFTLPSCTSTLDASKSLDGQADPLTVILVRHAEKLSTPNPGLTKEGQDRAERLAEILTKVEIDAVYSTSFNRTQLTARPTANGHQLDILAYDHNDLTGFAEKIKSEYQGKTVLIVGHSNTTPTLSSLLEGKASYQSFDELDYGNLVMITIPVQGPAKAIFLRY